MHIHETLAGIKRRSAQRTQQRQSEQQGADAENMDTVRLRAKVNARCSICLFQDCTRGLCAALCARFDLSASFEIGMDC